MAVYSIDGNSENKNGGTIRAGGTIASTKFTTQGVGRSRRVGNRVTDDAKADPADGAKDFNAQRKGKFVVKGYSTELAGAADTSLKGKSISVGNVPIGEGIRTRKIATAIRTNKWNEFSGAWDNGFPVEATDNMGNDNAAHPTRAVPGELTYMTGKKVPLNDNYKAKTS